MGHHHHECRYHRRQRQKKAAIVISVVALALVIIILLVLYFAVFKPKDPSVAVPVMQLPAFSSQGSPPFLSTIAFALTLQISIDNPNRAPFHLQSPSAAALYYGASQLGIALFPAIAVVPSQSSATFGITISTQAVSLNLTVPLTSPSTVLPLPVSSIVTVYGNVKTAGLFSLHSGVASVCNITLGILGSSGSIIEYTCKRSYPLDD